MSQSDYEKEKLQEYIMPLGKIAAPSSVETFGNLGDAAEGLLARVQSTARQAGRSSVVCTHAEPLRGCATGLSRSCFAMQRGCAIWLSMGYVVPSPTVLARAPQPKWWRDRTRADA